MSQRLASEGRPATAGEWQVLARWSSWGAIPQVFDLKNAEWAPQRERLRGLLDDDAWAAAELTTINAHYTDAGYVREIWGALQDLGFDGGRVLEPGAGAGTFIGMAPSSARMVGVELDGTTAAIAAGLYPGAEIRTESFADTRLPDAFFDATVGNVPFADVQLHDPVHNAGGHSMHNHFILKSLALTRPGGMVAVLTSSFTMDAVNPGARREMNELADLVGAVRLPSGAHRRSAGTEAITDLLIFRRREPGQPRRDMSWETVTPRIVDGERIRVNTYFDIHPEHVLGTFHVGNGMFGGRTVHVRAEDLTTTADRLHDALADITVRARERGDVFTAASVQVEEGRAAFAPAPENLFDGTIQYDAVERAFTIIEQGQVRPFSAPKSQHVELRALIGLRDQAKALIEAESLTAEDTTEIEAARDQLRADYDAYRGRFGPLNRFTLRSTGRRNEETGEETLARITPPAIRTIRKDPYGPLVLALERFDEETQTEAGASILVQRMNAPRHQARGAESAPDALAISLDETGGVDLALIADLLGKTPEEARTDLGELVYDDPMTGTVVHAPEYLSGEVRSKLEQAQAAVVDDARFQVNVDALRAVQPATLPVEDIAVKMGAVWISAEYHEQFLREVLDDRSVHVENPGAGVWTVKGARYGVKATNEYGTLRRPAPELAQALMEQRVVQVHDEIEDGDRTRRVLNTIETTAAQEKADLLQEKFADWVWADPARALDLQTTYNRQFNSIVLRDYTQAGDYLTLPGLAVNILLRPHQRTAVARMIAEPSVGLFHQVGAGKTLEMVVGATELRRMNLIHKPGVVVPNHMLEQFSREWLQAYPAARVLAVSSEDLGNADKRRLFVARAAANEWDAVIFTQSAFKKLGLSREFQEQYIDRELADERAQLEAAQGGDALSVKRMQRRLLQTEERMKKRLDRETDPGLTFEATGIDYLVVDEAHMYKNLETVSAIPGASIAGSDQARDLHMKLEYLRGKHGGRVATLATATPLANSVTEAYVMQRYLRPDLLKAAGIGSFDAWAATFGKTVTEMELSPTGQFRQKTRFAQFQNVPEMLRIWHVFADVKTAEDLNLPVPLLAARASDGKREPEVVVVPPSDDLLQFMDQLQERSEAVAERRVDPQDDNMLKISSDGRKAGLDLRMLYGYEKPSGLTKVDVAASRIAAVWQGTRDTTYLDDITGQPSPVKGALQLVFLDMGTPNEDRWDAYTELKAQLVQRGMPAESVRFIHDARNDAEKARMFAAARAGHISVLVGSTGKMGVGTNVQARLAAMHHVDCPWRPADLEQRDGRGIRQGNQNDEISVFRYVTERSFDAYMWQTVSRKAQFINQITRGKLDVREIEDIGDQALSAAEVKAIASGNPLLLELATADAEYQKLRRQEIAFHRGQNVLAQTRVDQTTRIENLQDVRAQLEKAQARTTDVAGDRFRMTVRDCHYDNRADAASAIAEWARRADLQWTNTTAQHLGRIGGHELLASTERSFGLDGTQNRVRIELEGVPYSGSTYPIVEVENATVGLIRTLENKTTAIGRSIVTVDQDLEHCERDLAAAETNLGKPFPRTEALHAAERRLTAVREALEQEDAPEPEAATQPDRAIDVDDQLRRLQEVVDQHTATQDTEHARKTEEHAGRLAVITAPRPTLTRRAPERPAPDLPAPPPQRGHHL